MLSRAEERLVQNLARRKHRARSGLLLAEGVRVIEELLSAGIVPRLALISSSLEDTDRGRGLLARLGAVAEVVRRLDSGELNRLASTESSQGVLVVAEAPASELGAVEVEGAATALVLDGVQDPGNLGTLVRSAAGFDVDVVACLPGTVDPWNPKAIRASAGALFRLPIVQPDEATLWEWLDARGFALLGADAAGDPAEAVPMPQRVALAVGNEGAGLSAAVRAHCTRLVAVPMLGGTESLNVAVAGAILLYLITRGRG